jgi:DNA adenine methylase
MTESMLTNIPRSPALPLPDPIRVCGSYAPPPLRWFGGKGDKKTNLGRSILALLGDPTRYYEPFAGGLSVLLAKPRAPVEVVNDLDADLVNFWTVVRDDPDGLLTLIPAPPATRGYPLTRVKEDRGGEEAEVLNPANKSAMKVANAFAAAQLVWAKERLARGGSPVERAACLFLLNRCSYGGRGTNVYRSRRVRGGHPEMINSYLSALAALSKVSARLRGVEIRNKNALDDIPRYLDDPDAGGYLDPPFLGDTRTGGGYVYDMREKKRHVELLELLNKCRGRVLLEGYWSPLYERLLDPARWQRYEKPVKVSVASGRKKNGRTQCLWVKKAG